MSQMLMRWLVGAGAAAMIVSGCKGSDDGGGGGDSPPAVPTSGCVQGVVLDGLTATRVPLPASAADKGIFVLARDQLLPAKAVVADATAPTANPLLVGEYDLCGIPLDQNFPIVVWLDGYQPFEGSIMVHSTAASRSPQAKEDLIKPTPVELANIRVYPKNQQVKDLQVFVTHDGAVLPGATVTLRAQGTNFLDPTGGGFLAPLNARTESASATTDDKGIATFGASSLVLGGHYTYTVIPPAGGASETTLAADTFILGLRDNVDTTDPYQIYVDLAHSVGPLVALSKSTDSQNPDATGNLVIYFNREIELAPGDEDNGRATLSGNVTAKVTVDVPGNNVSESVRVTIDANKLTLEPRYSANPDKDPSKEPLLAVTYSGVVVRPKASPETSVTLTINEAVHYYR